MPRTPIVLALLYLAAPAHMRAQALEPSARIRVRPPCERAEPCAPIIGQLHSMSGDTLIVTQEGGALRSLTLTPSTRIDLSHGYRSRMFEGLGLGALAGVLVGAIGASACSGPGDDSQCGLWYLVTVPPGVLLGGIVGAHFKTEWWLPAPVTRLAIRPMSGGGAGIGVVLGF